ncbi:MAG: hypothetical protein K9K93_02365, partial [Acholeplasmataceae bacterium]|nr:hypothetical protein [Acholeplasmataceae bacterium]
MDKLKWLLLGLMILFGIGVVFALAPMNASFEYDPRPSLDILASDLMPEDLTPVTQSLTPLDLEDYGFDRILENSRFDLYLNEATMNIALHDLEAGYIWTGFHPGIYEKAYTDTVRESIESGVTVRVFDATTLNEATMSLSDPDAGTVIEYEIDATGFTAHIDMVKLGLSFVVSVTMGEDGITVTIPHDSITEVPYKTVAMKVAKVYKVQSIALFPYFGSGNHEINGYALIPDGSGALIRYEEMPYETAYVKRLYGLDPGIQQRPSQAAHLKTDLDVSMPLFGINHGYQQAAFLAVMESGFGASELHSYPYMYNNIDINTTYFLYKTRDRSLIELSGGEISTIPLINEHPYPSDYQVSYTMLSDTDAGYSGMAKHYREMLELDQLEDQAGSGINLQVIGIDFKHGLLGKQHVLLTTYREAKDIASDLLGSGVKNLKLGYESWNKGGFFGANPTAFNPSRPLGGKTDLKELSTMALESDQMTLYLVTDPLVLNRQSWFQTVLKKTTLNLLDMPLENLERTSGYVRPIADVSETILDEAKHYDAYGIDTIELLSVGDTSFSYQLKRETVYREQMIIEMVSSLGELDDFSLVLSRPNDYLFRATSVYLDTPLMSNGYTFMTDSVPFLQ